MMIIPTTWSTLADRLEAKPVQMSGPTDPFSDPVVFFTVEERDELVAFLRAVPVETCTPDSARSARVTRSEDVVHDQASGRRRFCATCATTRATYFAGDGGTVRPGTECCATCQRAF